MILKHFRKNGSYEICTVCFWEDDAVMNANPDYWGGANDVCLRQVQKDGNGVTGRCSEFIFRK